MAASFYGDILLVTDNIRVAAKSKCLTLICKLICSVSTTNSESIKTNLAKIKGVPRHLMDPPRSAHDYLSLHVMYTCIHRKQIYAWV